MPSFLEPNKNSFPWPWPQVFASEVTKTTAHLVCKYLTTACPTRVQQAKQAWKNSFSLMASLTWVSATQFKDYRNSSHPLQGLQDRLGTLNCHLTHRHKQQSELVPWSEGTGKLPSHLLGKGSNLGGCEYVHPCWLKESGGILVHKVQGWKFKLDTRNLQTLTSGTFIKQSYIHRCHL